MAGSSRQNDRTSVFLEHEQLSSRPDQICMHALEAASVFLTIEKIEAWINLHIHVHMCRRMAGSSRQNDRTSVFLEHEQLSSRPDHMCMHALEAASVFLTIEKIEAWINLYIYVHMCRRMAGGPMF